MMKLMWFVMRHNFSCFFVYYFFYFQSLCIFIYLFILLTLFNLNSMKCGNSCRSIFHASKPKCVYVCL